MPKGLKARTKAHAMRAKVHNYICRNPGIGIVKISRDIGAGESMTSRHLKYLCEQGKCRIELVTGTRGGAITLYHGINSSYAIKINIPVSSFSRETYLPDLSHHARIKRCEKPIAIISFPRKFESLLQVADEIAI